MPLVFLISPARLDGARAKMLFQPASDFAVGRALRTQQGAPIGEVFRFVSGLYFRGKLAYAQLHARPPSGVRWLGSGALVITPNRGLVPAETRICLPHLEAFAQTQVDPEEEGYTRPLARDAVALAEALGPRGQAVLLGSIATGKYVDVLLEALGERLMFPPAFIGRGDMSRGGILLRAVATGTALELAPLRGASRRGVRAPRLVKRR